MVGWNDKVIEDDYVVFIEDVKVKQHDNNTKASI